MSKRKWNIYSSLAYFYNAFSSLADGKLVEEETSKILEVLLGWTKQEDDDLKAMALFVVQAETWLNEDIDGSTDKKDLVKILRNKDKYRKHDENIIKYFVAPFIELVNMIVFV